jgi:hypothetical protein
VRRRIIGVAVASAALAVLLFLVPLAVAVLNLDLAHERSDLERVALNAALVVDPAFSGRDLPEIPSAAPDTELGLYNTAGVLMAGSQEATVRAGPLPASPIAGSRSASGAAHGTPLSKGPGAGLRRAEPAAQHQLGAMYFDTVGQTHKARCIDGEKRADCSCPVSLCPVV